MTPTSFRNEGSMGRLPFILSLWMAISVALLSALAPLGPPSSRLTGSAFNPATTSVVLKARAQATPVAARAAEPDSNRRFPAAVLASDYLIAMAAALLIGIWLLLLGERFTRSPVAPKPPLLSRLRARAPPACS